MKKALMKFFSVVEIDDFLLVNVENLALQNRIDALMEEVALLQFQLRKEQNLSEHLKLGVVPLYPDVFPAKITVG